MEQPTINKLIAQYQSEKDKTGVRTFAEAAGVPYRTARNWYTGDRKLADYSVKWLAAYLKRKK